jgi:hypothetical protein
MNNPFVFICFWAEFVFNIRLDMATIGARIQQLLSHPSGCSGFSSYPVGCSGFLSYPVGCSGTSKLLFVQAVVALLGIENKSLF